MKRISAAVIFIMLMLTGCSTAGHKDALDANYVGEGQMTVLRYLIQSNALVVEDIFVEDHLETESSDCITNENGTYELVVSDTADTYEELRTILDSTYTAETVDEILNSDRYIDIDGKLYFNTKYAETQAEDYDWSDPELEVISVADGTYELEVAVRKENGFKHKFTVKAVTVDGDIRLAEMYY